jgi:toxin ParE1/3/4
MTAAGYVERLEAHCLALDTFPERGTRLPDGSRKLGVERSATVRFLVRASTVIIVTIAYRGRDVLKEPT